VAICPSCGKQQSDASAFCAACGAVLDRPDTAAASPAPPVSPTQIIPPAAPGAAGATRGADDFGDSARYIVRRLMALVVDLVGVTVLLAAGIQYLLIRGTQNPHAFGSFFAVTVYTLFALAVYLCLSEAYVGTTLGKGLFGLRVSPRGGGRVGLTRAVVRNVLLPFDLLLIGFLLAAFTPRHKRIGDFVAGTEVPNARSGVVGPAVALLIIGAWVYAEYAFADGARAAQTLTDEAQTYGPQLIGGKPTPGPSPTLLPQGTPAPTLQPTTAPSIAPSATPSAEATGNSSAPQTASPSAEATSSADAPQTTPPPDGPTATQSPTTT
jgi:uncharacterized RDD family membrane protein YckC